LHCAPVSLIEEHNRVVAPLVVFLGPKAVSLDYGASL
jgi:hypothetical protein